MNLEANPNYTLGKFIRDVLKERFPGNAIKQQVNDDDTDKLNFACPHCGDSEKDISKKRGNLFFKNNHYKCFNDGCKKWQPISEFVSYFARKYSLSIPNIKLAEEVDTVDFATTRKGFLIEFLMNPKVRNSLIDFEYLRERFFLMQCKDAPIDSEVGQYCRRRNLVDLPTFDDTCYYDSRDDKIYIFNLDLRSGKVLGLSIRRIEDGSGPKYDILNYSKFRKQGLVDDIGDDIINKFDMINNFYNILNVNFSKPIKITEGQINAMFLKNAIATTGVTKSKNLLGSLISKNNALILFDNDRAGKEEATKLIADGYRVFLWGSVIDSLRKKYPHLRKVINKINDVNDLFDFYVNIDNPMSIEEFDTYLEQYFSVSEFDLFLL